jgi:3-deoxy-D-manno-octulosonic-acid transferase
MERLEYWKSLLDDAGIRWRMRSGIDEPAREGEVLVWDTFGELTPAYQLADAAFVGGSLAPLGGQNFLEPFSCGIIPVIGRHWDNFHWIGKEIIEKGLVEIAGNWSTAASKLADQMGKPGDRESIVRRASEYLDARRGGAALAARVILEAVANEIPEDP